MLNSMRFVFRRILPAFLAAAALWIAPAAAAELPYGQGLLWRVQKDGGPASYVLGTIHSTDARLRKLPPEIERALDASRTLVFELLENPEGAAKLSRAMQLPPGRRLSSSRAPAAPPTSRR